MAKIDIYTPRILVAAVNNLCTPNRFLIETFFKGRRCFDTEQVDIDIKKGNRNVAAFVHPLSNGRLVEGSGYETRSVTPGYTKEIMPINPNQTIKRMFGEDYSKQLSPEQRAQRILGENLAELDTRIARLEEVMAAQALINGKVVIKGEKINHVVDFGYELGKQKIILSGSKCWDETGSDPQLDLQNWSEEISGRSSLAPDIIIVGSKVVKNLIDHPKIKERLDIRNYNVGSIDIQNETQLKKQGVIYYGTLAPTNIPIYSYSEKYFNAATGKLESLIPEDAVLLGSTSAGCELLYGLIKNMHALRSLPRFPLSWIENDGSARMVQLESAPLPSLVNVDAFVSAKVLSN